MYKRSSFDLLAQPFDSHSVLLLEGVKVNVDNYITLFEKSRR